jgi:hypothetical protein
VRPSLNAAGRRRVRGDPETGTIAWPNGFDLPPERLYNGARRTLVEPATGREHRTSCSECYSR